MTTKKYAVDERPILLIDGMNTFLQMWHAYACYTTDGRNVAGLGGFLIKMCSYVEQFKPSRIIVAWETGASQVRKQLFPEYKGHRRDKDPETKHERVKQLISITKLLKYTPITQIYLHGVEGDDIIAYLCTKRFVNRKKMIISTDRDYYQLLNKNTSIYSPIRKEWINESIVLKKHGITANNFGTFKALCGDPSDNIKGIKGIGEKTIKKLFPDISKQRVTVDDIYDTCKHNIDSNVRYSRIINEFDLIRLNWSIVQLDLTVLTNVQQKAVNDIIDYDSRIFEYEKFVYELINEGLTINHEALLRSMLFLHKHD